MNSLIPLDSWPQVSEVFGRPRQIFGETMDYKPVEYNPDGQNPGNSSTENK